MPDLTKSEPPTSAWGVPIETFPDHMVLRPPNRLMERATRKVGLRDKSDAEAIERAENALELLSSEFDGWMEDELVRLERMRLAFVAVRDDATTQALYRSAHDLRGQSATFGFPLAGEVADGLCQMLDDVEALPPQDYIDRHVEAIRAIVHEDVRDRDNATGKLLVAELAQLRAEMAAGRRRT